MCEIVLADGKRKLTENASWDLACLVMLRSCSESASHGQKLQTSFSSRRH